ncbi:MAG: DUF4893 domain-containing protein [Sphingomicrobium sp.]
MLLLLSSAGLALAACQTKPVKPGGRQPSVSVAVPLKADVWRAVASEADRDRLDRLGLAWSEALAEANRSNPADVRREGMLLRPRGGLDQPDPTPGSYNCRLIELGRGSGKARGPAFTAYKPFFCYVELDDGQLTFVKQTGSQRPSGRLWDDDDSKRMIFLGSIAMTPKDKALAYGDDARRDMAATFERVGPFRWRLVVPWPRDNSAKLGVYELTPVADQPE